MELFVITAFRFLDQKRGYWKVFKDEFMKEEAATEFASKLAACWIERRVYKLADTVQRDEAAETLLKKGAK